MNEQTPPTRRERNRHALLRMLPKGSVGAEIGVSTGGFSAVIMDEVAPKELVLIDPWDLLAQSADDDAKGTKWYLQEDRMAEYHQGVVDRFRDQPAVKVCRGFSMDVLGGYPDGYFDWTYIDAGHGYDDVCADLAMSVRKVKVGGLITGDDLRRATGDRKEVMEAVMDTLEKCGLPRRITGIPVDDLPDSIDTPSNLGAQFLIPLTQEMKDSFAG